MKKLFFTKENVGQWVEYIPTHEKGKLKSYDNLAQIAFIVFHCNDEWDNYENYTGESTRYSDLKFLNI